jgi:hypothetical protein
MQEPHLSLRAKRGNPETAAFKNWQELDCFVVILLAMTALGFRRVNLYRHARG